MRHRKQRGSIVLIGTRWHVRYWQSVTIEGTIKRKLLSHPLGPATTRGKRPPADIVTEAERFMLTINTGAVPAENITTIGEFVENVFQPWIDKSKRPSTAKGYKEIWQNHLKPLCAKRWLRETRTHHVQQWLDHIARSGLSRNTLSHIKNVISGIFTLAMQREYFPDNANPARNAKIDPTATAPEETYAYTLEEIKTILSLLPEPAATVFAVAAFSGLRHGEIQGLRWEDYRDGQLFVSRSIWNGKVGDPKTAKSTAPVPIIKQLADRLDMHRLRSSDTITGEPKTGPMFANGAGNPQELTALLKRQILPTLNRCVCGVAQVVHHEAKHNRDQHDYQRDPSLPEWHGWHACRRGLGSNLYRLGVSDKVIQRILRHSNVATTTGYYIKSADDDAKAAMQELENRWSGLTNSDRTVDASVSVQSKTLQ